MATKVAQVNTSLVEATASNIVLPINLSRLGITTLAQAQSVRVYSDAGLTTEIARDIRSVGEAAVRLSTLTNTSQLWVDYDGARSDYAADATYGSEAVWGTEHTLATGFDDLTTTTIRDGSQNGITLTKAGVGSPVEATGDIGKKQVFTPIGDFIDLDNSTAVPATDDFTLILKTTIAESPGASQGRVMFMSASGISNGDWDFNTDAGGLPIVFIRGVGTLSGTTDVRGGTYTLTFRRSGTTFSMLVDGVQEGTITSSQSLKQSQNYKLGRYAGSTTSNRDMDGSMDELRIVSGTAMSDDDVLTISNALLDEATFWGTWTDATTGAPTVTTQAASSITPTTATLNGNVTDLGEETTVSRAFDYRVVGAGSWTRTTPDTGITATGAYTKGITGLTAAEDYEYRSVVIYNSTEEVYGSTVDFTTAAAPTAPTVTTQAATDVAGTTATGNGNVTADGGETVTERGVCWSTTTEPTTEDSTATSAGTTGAFTAAITGLSGSTLYYVRAYAINSEGTSYGSEVTFTTTEVTVPKYAAYTKIAGELVRIS